MNHAEQQVMLQGGQRSGNQNNCDYSKFAIPSSILMTKKSGQTILNSDDLRCDNSDVTIQSSSSDTKIKP